MDQFYSREESVRASAMPDADFSPISSSDGESSDAESDAGGDAAEEVTALCWSGGSVGIARYLCAECRIEVFEAPVCVVAGEAVRRRHPPFPPAMNSITGAGLPSHSRRGGREDNAEGATRILVYEDVPPSLLWLVRYLEVHQPQILLPHTGSEALHDLVDLVSTHTPLPVMRLSALTAFCAADALPRLAAMYPAQAAELASRFHAEKTAMMRAMAALLQFVAAGQANVADVVERGVLHALYLEDTCAEALQITRTERHPSSAQGRGRAKEGLSLRGLLSTAQSTLGRAMLRQWIALPCCDVAEIDARQSVVAFFVDAEHAVLASQLRAALHRIRPTTHIFTTMRCGRASRKHYVSLYRTLRGVAQVQRLLSTVAHLVSRLYVLLQSIAVEPLTAMAEALARTVAGVAVTRPSAALQNRVSSLPGPATASLAVNAPASALTATTAVRICDGVDAVLDELRLRLHELRLSLLSKAEAAFDELPWELRSRLSLRCAYAMPHGYLLCVPTAELMSVVDAYVPQEIVVSAGQLPAEEEMRAQSESATESDGCSSCSGSTPEADATSREEGEGDEVNAEFTSLRKPQTDNIASGTFATTPAAASAAAASARTQRERVCSFMLDAFRWQFHHETLSGECCFKSAAMEELDTWVGDLQRRVQQRENEVRRELDTSLLYSSLYLLRPTRALGELDCLLGFARVSAQEGWCRPVIAVSEEVSEVHNAQRAADSVVCADTHEETPRDVEEGVLEIENGWHPLLSRQLGLQQLIPFSVRLNTATDRVCVVLGVNGSGKSVLISAIAHIVFLAHVGCHVPATAARMSLINSIFAPSSFCASSYTAASPLLAAPMGSEALSYAMRDPSTGGMASAGTQAEVAQSSFYAECVALHRVLHHVAGQQRAVAAAAAAGAETSPDAFAGRALVLLDEFGRGTAPEDGCALLKGTLRYFATGGVLDTTSELGTANTTCMTARTLHETSPAGLLSSLPRWRRPPLVLCATHLVEMLTAPSGSNPHYDSAAAEASEVSRCTTTGAAAAQAGTPSPQRAGALKRVFAPTHNTPEADLALPLECIKIYDMEAIPTYAPDDAAALRGDMAAYADQNNSNAVVNAELADTPLASRADGDAPRRLPLDVTPTFRPVCVTPHTGQERWEDWCRHAGAHLDAGPALGRQCGLDADLLACWESALSALNHSA